jgi:RNA polymerase sigma-70 factor (ECF subfamily)
MRSDLELLEAWRAGDRSAGSELADRHFDRLWRFFRLRADPPEVADLIQRTLLGAVESRDRPVHGGRFLPYLLGIAKRIIVQHYAERRRDRVVPGAPSPDATQADARSPTSLVALKEQQHLLLLALRSLPLPAQLILELTFWEELSGAEIALVLECPPGTVKSRLSRAKTALRDAIVRLARSPELAQSTTDGLEQWAHSIRWFLRRTGED